MALESAFGLTRSCCGLCCGFGRRIPDFVWFCFAVDLWCKLTSIEVSRVEKVSIDAVGGAVYLVVSKESSFLLNFVSN